MRKSERLRQLEIAVIRLEMHVELLTIAMSNLLETQGMTPIQPAESLDSGKWYKRPSDNS
jgi:hypothetical protein